MGRETESIIQLLKYWQQYTGECKEGDLAGFSSWLYEQYHREQTPAPAESLYTLYGKESISTAHKIGWRWGRLIRFTKLLIKKAFRQHLLKSMEEYGIMKYIALTGAPTKVEVAQYSLLEHTTCFEMLKRLKKQGLINEMIDEQDRRSRRVSLTRKGQEVIREGDTSVGQLADALSCPLQEQEQAAMLAMLEKLDDFHARLHSLEPDVSLEEMLKKYARQ